MEVTVVSSGGKNWERKAATLLAKQLARSPAVREGRCVWWSDLKVSVVLVSSEVSAVLASVKLCEKEKKIPVVSKEKWSPTSPS